MRLNLAGPPSPAPPRHAAVARSVRVCGRLERIDLRKRRSALPADLWQRAEADYVALLEDDERRQRFPRSFTTWPWFAAGLGDAPRLAEGLRTYAGLDVPWDDAVEAHALADLLAPDGDERMVETEQRWYAVDRRRRDFWRSLFLTDGPTPLCTGELSSSKTSDGKPRHAFLVLDRPLPATGVGMQIDDVPTVLLAWRHCMASEPTAPARINVDRRSRRLAGSRRST